jgi:hypothetical protein
MTDTISDAIRNIRKRKRKLEAELKLLVKAEAALSQIVGVGGDGSKNVDTLPSDKAANASGVSEAVCSALVDLGEAESGEIITQIRAKYMPAVNENTVRSLLSVWAVKGRVVRNGKKYSLPKESPGDGATATA